MRGPHPTSLALAATPAVRELLREAAKEPGVKAFCTTVRIKLDLVERWLQENQGGQGADDERILELLDHLEKLLQEPARLPRPPRPLGTTNKPNYENIKRLLSSKNRIWAAKSIKEFASHRSTKDRNKLRQFLKSFDGPQPAANGPELSDLQPQISQQPGQDDLQSYLKDLHSVLSANCLCQRPDNRGQIVANLRLNGHVKEANASDRVSFSLFFLDHPHQHLEGTQCHWQDTEICVFRTRGVKFKDKPEAVRVQQDLQPISINKFCEVISYRQQSRLQLVVSDGALAWKGSDRLQPRFFQRLSSVPLSNILNRAKLSRKMLLLLAYQLAKATWQFYESEWMRSEWNKDTLHFMFEKRGNTPKGIFVNEPFLSTYFHPEACQDNKNILLRSHSFPNILSLGIMLVEIELGVRIEDHYIPECYDGEGRLSINANHIAVNELFERADLWEKKETFKVFKEVIEACLKPDHFKAHMHDPKQVRDALLKHVVKPLSVLYELAWGSPDTSEIHPIEPDQVGDASAGLEAVESLPESQPQPRPTAIAEITKSLLVASPNPKIPSGAVAAVQNVFSSDEWFVQLQKLTGVIRLKPEYKDDAYTPVKIAILDTGIAESCSSMVAGYKDFVSKESTDMQDGVGHGTDSLRLLQRVCPDAKIYVGRVWETDRASQTTADLMTEAIRYARQEWKVDVIAMPSGFQAENEDMLESIEEANMARILIFSAASNNANLREIAFPARLYRAERLFCMFSTNADARSSPGFNPSPMPDARNSFAILGEDIMLGAKGPLSGTSYSTIIAAGLAARILDFSRHRDVRVRMRKAKHLRRVEGMAAVFAKMSKSDNSYRCIVPWKILGSLIDEDVRAARPMMRERVCDTISTALEEVYGA